MDFLWLVPTLFSLLFAFACIFLFQSRERTRAKLTEMLSRLASAEAVAEGAKEQLAERRELRQQLDEAIAARHDALKQVELANQKMADLNLRMKDWESQREESVKAAKAAILEAGGQMSSKLLEDHKREQEAHKKQQEEAFKKTTEGLFEQVTTITKTVASLNDQTRETKERMHTVWKSLSSPGGAGQMAEVGLENSLKNLGLEPGRDFSMQYHIAGENNRRLRPDAVIFLPQNMVMVVDSKASKFLLELAEAEGTEQEDAARASLSRSMSQHVKDLSSKDYKSAIEDAFKAEGHGGRIHMVMNIMYLPGDGAVEKIKKADSAFMEKVEKAGLILAGPASLAGLFSLARMNIAVAQQAENQGIIIENIENLMESVSTVMGHVDKIGRGIKSAADGFNSMASSANRRLIPRMKALTQLGVKPARNKELPKPIASYDVRRIDDMFTFDGEAETIAETKKIAASAKKENAEV